MEHCRFSYMFRNASGPGAENVINPIKYENILNPIPFARIVVGKISEHQTKEGASMNWNSTMKRKMKATAAPRPAWFPLPRYARCRRASARRLIARAGKPITEKSMGESGFGRTDATYRRVFAAQTCPS